MSSLVTDRAHTMFAFGTDTDLATLFNAHMLRLNPFSTALAGAVYPVLCLVLFEFPVPCCLEIVVEEGVDVAEGDVSVGTASRGHVSGVFDGHFEDALEAAMAHPVATWEFGTFPDGDIVGTACET